ncbi:SprT family zinc-dependent metalloprotease [Planctobacterium marinum]|uniref:Zinc metalloprotease n=1 Tax=Planctobacterium marinum TaxID=1631968 RepID=A0AA48KN01_9ALTE|nr:zinc metalloprotease [Planctobacterium marinum]
MQSVRLKVQQDGQLMVSCPYQVTDAQVTEFLNQRLNWITQQQQRLASIRQQITATSPTQGMHLWGQYYAFEAIPPAKRKYETCHSGSKVYLPRLPENLDAANLLQQQIWRDELKHLIQTLLPQWQTTMNVEVAFWNVKNMKTKWGSCNVTKRRIWLSLKLAHYPKECTEMVLVHELTHLLEASHNKRFYQLMDSFLPNWRDADLKLKNRTFP